MQDLEVTYQQWADIGNKKVVTRSSSKKELDEKFLNFNSMPYDLRLKADDESIRLFGKTNKQRYEEFDSYFLKKDNINQSNHFDNSVSTNEAVENNPPIALTYTCREIVAAQKWMDTSQKIIIIPTNTNEELEKLWSDFNSMIKKHRRESDWKSLELFGMTNETHYNILKSRFNKLDIPDYDKSISNDVSISSTSESFIETGLSYINSLDSIIDYDFIKESLYKLSNLSTSQYESILIENAYSKFNNENKSSEFINICESIRLSDDGTNNNKDNTNNIIHNALKPIYIVLIEGSSLFSKTIKKITKGIFSHAAISFDSSLKNMYSFNINTTYGHDGLSNESIDKYPKDNMLGVFTIFVKEKQYESIKKSVDYYIDNADKTKYAFSNLLPMIFNIPTSNDFKMVCSQFVDNILKLAKIDITNKDSSLVNPNDFNNAAKENKKIYIIHYDKTKLYNKNKVNRTIENMLKKNKADAIVESSQTLVSCLESKEFPAQFDKDGNLFIKNTRNTKSTAYFNAEFSRSHTLLLQYSKVKNIEAMKYEISKLWYMNIKIQRILSQDIEVYERKLYIDVRALILNDFNKYLSEILKYDKTFNFTEYYNDSPFSDDTIKVNKNTLKFTIDMIKRIIR